MGRSLMTQHMVVVLAAVVAVQTVIILFLLFKGGARTQAASSKGDNRMIGERASRQKVLLKRSGTDVGMAIAIHQDQKKVSCCCPVVSVVTDDRCAAH